MKKKAYQNFALYKGQLVLNFHISRFPAFSSHKKQSFFLCSPSTATSSCAEMLLTNRLLLFFCLAIWILAIVHAVQAQATKAIPYAALRPDKSAGTVTDNSLITVGSSVTTDEASSWISSSGRFAFGFYHEDDGFSVGIQLFASPSETVIVWTARPNLKRFSKDAFLNFTDEGLFVTPEKGATAFLLFNFSSSASSATMLDNGNFVVYGDTNSSSYNRSQVSLAAVTSPAAKTGRPYYYTRGCSAYTQCRGDGDNIIWRSFDYPSDTILGNQILYCGYNLTSSASKTDHLHSEQILNLPCGGSNLISYRLNSADKNWDTGASGGDYSSLNLDEDGSLYLTSSGGIQKDLSSYKPNNTDDDILYRATLDPDSIFRLYALNLDTNLTTVVNEIPYYKDKCQTKAFCGVNSYCVLVNSEAQCSCMPGFEYIHPDSHFTGCRRAQTVPSCSAVSAAAGIVSMETVDNMVGMDELAYGVVSAESKDECSNTCLSDCNCDAATFIDQKCLKLKLPLVGGRKDFNYPNVAFIKLAGAGAANLTPTGKRRRREIRFIAILISVASTISFWIVVISAFIGAYWLLYRRFRAEWREWELALTEEIAPRYFSYQQLLKGSNEFKEQLGKGGQGMVFKAELSLGNRAAVVAVKKLHGAEMEGESEFQAEMRLIGRAYHANLVRLLGFCHDGPRRLIVYEFMSRGSLANHILESRGRRPSWERRVAILLGAARGIHYLHCECEAKIIHRDIKPENILIAKDWTAKIADFGLAKLLNRDQTRAATRTLAAGTEGYVAPECERAVDATGEAQVTEKADVYSYGMVVLETICGKRNREVNLSLRELVRKSYEADELWKLVDGEQVEASQLEKLVKIGLLCVQADPTARPLMEDVVMMLEGYIDVPTPPPPVPLSL